MKDRAWPTHDDRRWYVQRGIPVVPILSFLLALVVQSILGVTYITGLSAKIEAGNQGLIRLEGRVDRLDVKVQALSDRLEGSFVPAAVNGRRLDDLERHFLDLVRRINELERRSNSK